MYGIEVVFTTRIFFLNCRVSNRLLSTIILMVHESTGRGAVYLCPILLELIDGSTSSCVATDYH
jgi:hypothetical protein